MRDFSWKLLPIKILIGAAVILSIASVFLYAYEIRTDEVDGAEIEEQVRVEIDKESKARIEQICQQVRLNSLIIKNLDRQLNEIHGRGIPKHLLKRMNSSECAPGQVGKTKATKNKDSGSGGERAETGLSPTGSSRGSGSPSTGTNGTSGSQGPATGPSGPTGPVGPPGPPGEPGPSPVPPVTPPPEEPGPLDPILDPIGDL